VWLGYEGEYARMGQPFTFVLRDILQFDTKNEDAVKVLFMIVGVCVHV
jgi:hypothetical protein